MEAEVNSEMANYAIGIVRLSDLAIKSRASFFYQWEAKPKPICTRDFLRALSKLEILIGLLHCLLLLW